jgi:hypothetical protein
MLRGNLGVSCGYHNAARLLRAAIHARLYTLVESDRQVDTWRGARHAQHRSLETENRGTGKDFQRLTRFKDFEGGKASNAVVSGDGRSGVQFARTTDEAE